MTLWGVRGGDLGLEVVCMEQCTVGYSQDGVGMMVVAAGC